MLLGADLFVRLCRARDMLREVPLDAVDSLGVAEIAGALGLSPFHFIRQFEAVFGRTPHQYRIESRVERARHLLAGGDLSVTEVCMEVGFSSLGSFSAMFTRRVGATPSAYQRRLRGVVQMPAAVSRPLTPGCLGLMAALPPGALRNFREA